VKDGAIICSDVSLCGRHPTAAGLRSRPGIITPRIAMGRLRQHPGAGGPFLACRAVHHCRLWTHTIEAHYGYRFFTVRSCLSAGRLALSQSALYSWLARDPALAHSFPPWSVLNWSTVVLHGLVLSQERTVWDRTGYS